MASKVEDFKEKILGYEKKFTHYVLDPLHGPIGLTKLEENVIQTKAFKRLKHIQQLGFTSNIYPAANHTRYEHSIGTLHVTWTMFKRFILNFLEQKEISTYDVLNYFSDDIIDSLRLSALLHDLGHGPFSHSFEKVASIFGQKIDHDELSVFLLTEGYTSEILKTIFPNEDELKLLVQEDNLKIFIKELGFIPQYTRDIIIGIYKKRYELNYFPINKFLPIKLFLNSLLKGDIGSDRIDYLLRDTYFSGLGHRFNFPDLLENLRGFVNPDSNKLYLAISHRGKNIIEFIMLTRYYHYRLIAHHMNNIKDEIIFYKRVELDYNNNPNDKYFINAAMNDDRLLKMLPEFNNDLVNVGIWNLGSIGVDHYRFFFYRIISDPYLKEFYIEIIKKNIVNGVNKKYHKNVINEDDLFITFVIEKPHIPILHMHQPVYKIKKDVIEKYSVLLHDHSLLIKSLAQTYLEDSALYIYSSKKNLEYISKYVYFTHHFYLNEKIFRTCLNKLQQHKNMRRYDFLVYALFHLTNRGREVITGITHLSRLLSNIHKKSGLDFYDFDKKEFFDPDSGLFNYPKVINKDSYLIDDLYLLHVAGLLEVKSHLIKRIIDKEVFYATSYIFYPTIRHREIGLRNIYVPLQTTLGFYPQQLFNNIKLK